EGVAREAARWAEDPVDAELGLAEHEGLAGAGGDGLDLDAEEKADGVDDAAGGPLLPVHLDEDRGEAALAQLVQVEGERVAEVGEDEVDERLRRPLEVEHLGEAIDLGEQQVGDLLQARDEAPEVA